MQVPLAFFFFFFFFFYVCVEGGETRGNWLCGAMVEREER